MDERELLARIDRHLERGNELAEQNNEIVLGLRQFTHDLLVRFETLTSTVVEAMREQAAVMRKQGKTMEDLTGAAKAHEQTLLFILDELKALRRADGTT
jgi:hypothetical protein